MRDTDEERWESESRYGYLTPRVKQFLKDKGLPADRMTYVGSGVYADTWQLPHPWQAVVRITKDFDGERSVVYERAKTLMNPHAKFKHLPRVANVWVVGQYIVVLMNKYLSLSRSRQHSGYGVMQDGSGQDYYGLEREFDKMYDAIESEMIDFLDIMPSDAHGYNLGKDYHGNIVMFDVW